MTVAQIPLLAWRAVTPRAAYGALPRTIPFSREDIDRSRLQSDGEIVTIKKHALPRRHFAGMLRLIP
jgi:hypothetical protein